MLGVSAPCCRVVPEPGFSWLLSHVITLLDGYGPQVRGTATGAWGTASKGARRHRVAHYMQSVEQAAVLGESTLQGTQRPMGPGNKPHAHLPDSVSQPHHRRVSFHLYLQAATSVRGLLVHLKSTSRDGGLVSHLVEGLTLLYDEAQELHGDEDVLTAAGKGVGFVVGNSGSVHQLWLGGSKQLCGCKSAVACCYESCHSLSPTLSTPPPCRTHCLALSVLQLTKTVPTGRTPPRLLADASYTARTRLSPCAQASCSLCITLCCTSALPSAPPPLHTLTHSHFILPMAPHSVPHHPTHHLCCPFCPATHQQRADRQDTTSWAHSLPHTHAADTLYLLSAPCSALRLLSCRSPESRRQAGHLLMGACGSSQQQTGRNLSG
jgi:hypothetical protein